MAPAPHPFRACFMIRGEAPGFHLLPGRRGRRLVYSPWRSRFRVPGSAPSAWGSRSPRGVGNSESAPGAQRPGSPGAWNEERMRRGWGRDWRGAGRGWGGGRGRSVSGTGEPGLYSQAGGRAEWGTACSVITSLSGPPSPSPSPSH